jgi:CRISPR-associated protein Cmr2
MSRESSLLKFQIGPVQDFIAQARSTRDLWSGSYLLSWLVAKGIKSLPKDAFLVFPSREGQPLLADPIKPDADGILIPNLPNIFIASIPGDATSAANTAKEIEKAIRNEWQAIADAVWKQGDKIELRAETKDRFKAQVDRHLSISWQATELTGDYAAAYQHNGWHLDAVRQTRDFQAWDSAIGMTEKDSLSGKEEALIGGKDFQQARQSQKDEYGKLFKHADYLGAVALIKRVWHLAYLQPEHKLRCGHGQHHIRSIPAIAARGPELDDDALAQEKAPGEKYIAAIAFDGDSIGKWVNGDFLPKDKILEDHHSDFSKALSDFAMKRVRPIVEKLVPGKDQHQQPIQVPLGQLIYAGGDDVVCLVPADAALEVAAALRAAFRKATENTPSTSPKPDASAGIAIAHIHSPLQDLIREAQKAEKRAKNDGPRPAVSVTLMKRSGEISYWTAQWDKGGLDLYRAIAERLKPGGLSGKFPHRVCQLLTPYLTRTTGLSKQEDAIHADTAKDLIVREFIHAAVQQGSPEIASQLHEPLQAYLNKLTQQDTQALLTAILDLCTTVAFADRTKPAAEKQPAP